MNLSRAVAAFIASFVMTAGGAAAQSTVFLVNDSTTREVWRGETGGSQAGLSLDRGDVGAGDSRRDLIAGAPGWNSQTGRVYVVFAGPVRRGQVSFANANAILTGGAPGDRFGEATAAGYITAQELAVPLPNRDLVVGAPGAGGNAGAVYVFRRGLLNNQDLDVDDALLTITGAPAGARLGTALATGDLDGDGYREIIAGAPGVGTVYVIRGGPSISGTVNLAIPSAAFFAIEGSAVDGVGRSLAAGDLFGHGLDGTNKIYDLAIGAHNESGGGAVYIIKGRTANSFPGIMSLTSEADARFGGIGSGDQAGLALEIAPFDRDGIYDLIVGAPRADGPGNSRADAGEVYIVWGSATLTSRSLSAADVTVVGARPGDMEGSDLAYGPVARGVSNDVVFLAPGASTRGELHVLLGRQRSAFGAVYDLASTTPDRRFVSDPAGAALASVLIYDHTGEGFEDVVAGMPGGAEGLVYVSFSPNVQDNGEPNDTYTSSTSVRPAVQVSSYVFTQNDVDWYKFQTRTDAHVRIQLAVPDGLNYAIELYDTVKLLRTSNNPGPGIDEEILLTLPAGLYYVRVIGSGQFSQFAPYTLLTTVGSFSDSLEPNNTISRAVTIGTLPHQSKVYTLLDLDWYRFRTTASGTVTIGLEVPATLNFQLVLYNAAGAYITSSQNGPGVNETITRALATGEYLVRVSSGGSWSTTSTYRLTVSGSVVANPAIPNIMLGLGPRAGDGGWAAVRGGAESSFGALPFARLPWPAYNGGGGGVRVATGDVDGDGADEVVMGLGPGSNGYAAVLDDAAHSHALLAWIRVDWPTYTSTNGEVFPAVGDLDGDGRAEIVLGLGNGGKGWYQIFDDWTQRFRHLAWRQVPWSAYNAGPGPTHPAVGDLDGDNVAEIVVGLGSGSNGWLQIANSGLSGYSHRGWRRIDWPAYAAANGATFPAIGDVDGDGRGEIVAGLGTGSQGWFQVMDDATTGFAHMTWDRVTWSAYNAYSGETHPAIGNIDG
ncbi:MAG: FG-GAP-like repeat-containing protein, partial [Vicinamibacterales bacterium]